MLARFVLRHLLCCAICCAGNPDWQSQSFSNVETMFDAVEYSVGWLEFWLQRANTVGE